jgi:hypothetical protein
MGRVFGWDFEFSCILYPEMWGCGVCRWALASRTGSKWAQQGEAAGCIKGGRGQNCKVEWKWPIRTGNVRCANWTQHRKDQWEVSCERFFYDVGFVNCGVEWSVPDKEFSWSSTVRPWKYKGSTLIYIIKCGRCVSLTTSQPSVCRLSRKCVMLDVS